MEDKLLQALLPFFPLPMQKRLMILFKFLELWDLLCFYGRLERSQTFSPPPQPFTVESFLERLKRQLSPAQQEELEGVLQMLQMLQTMSAFREEGKQEEPGEFFSELLSPEQGNLFATLEALFAEEEASSPC